MSSTLLRSQSNKRPASRSGSASPSSSVVTVKRVTSPTLRNGTRPSNPGLTSQTPTLVTPKPAISESPAKRRRSQSRPRSSVAIGEGIVNLNRWSQSTTGPGKASVTSHQRKNSLARRLSGSFGSLAAYNTPPSPASTKNLLRKTNPTPAPPIPTPRSPNKMASNPPTVQTPPIPGRAAPAGTLPSLASAVDAAPTPQNVDPSTPTTSELLPSATYMPGDGDYFGEAWAGTSPAKQRKVQRSSSTSSYIASPSNNQIKPGAKNSFAPSPNPIESSPARIRQPPPISKANPHVNPPRIQDQSNIPGGGDGDNQTSSAVPAPERKSRQRKPPSQKSMLAKALEKAKHAVVLDNAQNFESAVEAYADACNLLHHVMVRTPGDEDKKKLEAIKNTYKARILELQSNELAAAQTVTEKALPDVPQAVSTNHIEPFSPSSDEEDPEPDGDGPSGSSRFDEDQFVVPNRPLVPRTLTREQLPPRRQSLMPRERSRDGPRQESSPMRRGQDALPTGDSTMLAVPMETNYMPPPLSPRRPPSPLGFEARDSSNQSSAPEPFQFGHTRQETAESTSWLDTIDESGGSSSSSVHSKSSLEGLRRKHLRTGSGDTEAEFDAALDAAVEAAYDEGYEPASDTEEHFGQGVPMEIDPAERISEARRNIDLAKQRVREAEREAAIANAKEKEKTRRIEEARAIGIRAIKGQSVEIDYDDDEAEEEERMLEEMTREYIMEDVEYDGQTKSALPRESDSSGFSGRTWGSSVGSVPATAGTPLSTVTETAMLHQVQNMAPKKAASTLPPPTTSLPPPPGPPSLPTMPPQIVPTTVVASPPSMSILSSPGVRERRLSGQKVKQLKIDTNAKLPSGMSAPRTQPLAKLGPSLQSNLSEAPKSASIVRDGQVDPTGSTLKQGMALSSRFNSSPYAGPSSGEPASGTSEATPKNLQRGDGQGIPLSGSPVRQPGKSSTAGVLRKNFSSSSLKSLRQPLVTPPTTEDSPSTPMSRMFSNATTTSIRNGHVPSVPDLPTPSLANFAKAGISAGTLSFFDSDIHSPHTPGSPNPASANAPVPLEPCPESFLLRPFWLLRALYQTLAHPRGGYISTRLFVPRDVWRVKNVKLRNVDEKIASCDLLTAALLKLSRVDTLDADAVMEEMQAFELVLDQVQGQLGKKLGAEVGVQGSAAMFKASPAMDDGGLSNELLSAKSLNAGGGKSYLSSWRKLRSKNSLGPGLPSSVNGGQGRETSREALTMRSLPMTSTMSTRFPKRDPTKVLGIGPHAHYMAALARLCDAVQVVDQIARQVEDPGLRLSSQTHVGLELSTRHAAEFFAFFVCRFALTDIGMMLDKFVKRGSEWVLG